MKIQEVILRAVGEEYLRAGRLWILRILQSYQTRMPQIGCASSSYH
jgi:hypothetical protein